MSLRVQLQACVWSQLYFFPFKLHSVKNSSKENRLTEKDECANVGVTSHCIPCQFSVFIAGFVCFSSFKWGRLLTGLTHPSPVTAYLKVHPDLFLSNPIISEVVTSCLIESRALVHMSRSQALSAGPLTSRESGSEPLSLSSAQPAPLHIKGQPLPSRDADSW